MSKALIASPVFSDELGLLMFKAEASALQAFRELLASAPVLLAPVPDELAVKGAGLVEHKPVARLPANLVQAFLQEDRVFQALGGTDAFTRWQGRPDRCVAQDDDCMTVFTWSSGALPVPLCWHHDNLHNATPQPGVTMAVARRLLAFGLSRVAAFVGRDLGAEVSAAELAWWASAHGVHGLLPESLAMLALGRKATATDRHTAHGWKDTDARYDTRDHIAEVREMVKPIKFAVDAEPPASFMARPKLTRWQSEAYLRFVRSQPCVVTGSTQAVEAHHVIGHGHSGMAMKTHDLMAFPLCHAAHMKLHDGGWQQWEREHGSQLEHVMAILNRALGLGVFG